MVAMEGSVPRISASALRRRARAGARHSADRLIIKLRARLARAGLAPRTHADAADAEVARRQAISRPALRTLVEGSARCGPSVLRRNVAEHAAVCPDQGASLAAFRRAQKSERFDGRHVPRTPRSDGDARPLLEARPLPPGSAYWLCHELDNALAKAASEMVSVAAFRQVGLVPAAPSPRILPLVRFFSPTDSARAAWSLDSSLFGSATHGCGMSPSGSLPGSSGPNPLAGCGAGGLRHTGTLPRAMSASDCRVDAFRSTSTASPSWPLPRTSASGAFAPGTWAPHDGHGAPAAPVSPPAAGLLPVHKVGDNLSTPAAPADKEVHSAGGDNPESNPKDLHCGTLDALLGDPPPPTEAQLDSDLAALDAEWRAWTTMRYSAGAFTPPGAASAAASTAGSDSDFEPRAPLIVAGQWVTSPVLLRQLLHAPWRSRNAAPTGVLASDAIALVSSLLERVLDQRSFEAFAACWPYIERSVGHSCPLGV